MTKKSTNIITVIVMLFYVVYSIFFPKEDIVSSTILRHSIVTIWGIILYYILNVLQNVNQIKLLFQTKILYRKKDIRLSLSYLFRIKVDNSYLLVKSSHRDYYQPVGGVYKTLPGSERIFEELKVKSDRLIETEKGIAKGDLRVYVKGKNVLGFLKWYNSKEDREISPWREFCEELIPTGILPWKQFRYIDYKYKGIVKTPLITLVNGDKGLFTYEIYDLIVNDEQKPYLQKLLQQGNTEDYIWVNEYLINRLGHDEREKKYIYKISPHTKWALNMKWSK